MARCPALNCTAQPSIAGTTDIAGPGVLYSYLISAMLAVAAIIYGYLSDSLPEWYLNETDKTVIASFHALLPSEETTRHLRSPYERVKALLGGGRQREPNPVLTKEQREEVLKRFVLTLSDQQLVTGLSILIAAIANQCKLTVWEFELAFSLAWFSSTTHLATLDCLREYFIAHGTIHNWRVLGMVVLLVLLMYSLVIAMGSVDSTIPVQCTYRYFGDRMDHPDSGPNAFDVLSAVLTLVLLTWLYAVRIVWCFKRGEGRAARLDNIIFWLQTRRHKKALKPIREELDYMVIEAWNEHRSTVRRRRLEQIRDSNGLRRRWLIAIRASYIYNQSFLSLAPMLTFMISFGFTQLYLNRWQSGAPVVIDKSMSFGQITPVFLLILPVMSAAEVYHEVQSGPTHAISRRKSSASKLEQAMSAHEADHWRSGTGSPTICKPDYSITPRDPAQCDKTVREYHEILPQIQRYFYLETKIVAKKSASMETFSHDDQEPSVESLKAHLVSSYRMLSGQKPTLKVTTRISLVEFALCTIVSIALGISTYIEGIEHWSTVASYILFAVCVLYKVSGLVAYLLDIRLRMNATDYKRLMDEARSRSEKEGGRG